MVRKNSKIVALVLAAGTLFQFGFCNLQQLAYNFATAALIEFVTDNDGVFDLFEDGAEAAAE